MAKAPVKPKAAPPPDPAPEPAPSAPNAVAIAPEPVVPVTRLDQEIRHLTPEEEKILLDDTAPPEGYALIPSAPEPSEPEPTMPTEPEPAAPQATTPPAELAPTKKDFFERVEGDLAAAEKEGVELKSLSTFMRTLNDYTPREKAYFAQMYRDRKMRQKAEAERDQALFRAAKQEQAAKAEPPAPAPVDLLKDKADDDLLTAGELRAILKAGSAPTPTAPPAATSPDPNILQVQYLKLCEKDAKRDRADFDAVMTLCDDLVTNDPAMLEVIAQKTQAGENPAVVIYDLIKGHRDFPLLYPAVEARLAASAPPAEPSPSGSPSAAPVAPPALAANATHAQQAEAALEANLHRPKTTAHVASQEGKPAPELTLEEVVQMKDSDFARLPKATRARYLRMLGA